GQDARGSAYEWLLSRSLVLGVPVEIGEGGEISGDIDQDQIRKKVIELLEGGARGLVVGIKGSHRNNAAEAQIRDIVRNEFPRHFLGALPTLVSSEISQSRDDGLRLRTALISAYIHHGLARHLYKAEEEIRRRGYSKPLLVVHANGSVARVAKSVAAYTYNSGPAAGLVGSNELGSDIGVRSGLTLDIGGTSTDIGAVGDIWKGVENSVTVDGVSIDVPAIVADSLGGGGGSIARAESNDVKVGPQSAGAYPGPMCYGLGGESPTVTDANLVLGYLDPATFLGGRRNLDIEKARQGILEHIAEPLGISIEQGAWKIRQAVDQIVADGLTSYADARRLSPDVLFAYGGGGPTHVSTVADILGVPTAYCFPMSPVFSAYGSSRMDVSHLYEASLPGASGEQVAIGEVTRAMKEEAQRDMLGEGFDPSNVAFEIQAGVSPENDPQAKAYVPLADEAAAESSHVMGQARDLLGAGGGAGLDGSVVWDTVRMKATAPTPHPALMSPEYDGDYRPRASSSSRPVWTGDAFEDVCVHEASSLSAGDLVSGPAIIESEFTTILVTRLRDARIDGANNVVMIAKQESGASQ
ncbi:MAG: hydantoinase/oxoprolinase family protein, partial [Gammaproteobacteria bacterium]|nr:hydantoinase/oxoprolinase family protein [Gammaproteobacteria bacterium]